MNQLDIFELTKPTFKFTHRPIKLFEAFAGIGCQAMALDKLGVEYENVGISEIDKYAIQSYNAINGDTKNYGDISKLESIPKCDIFTYSFPCTDLSKAGQQKGLQSKTRSGLIYEVLRVLHNTKDKPQVLIMENVPDLVQEKFKREWYDIQLEIEQMGYSNYTARLNAKDYGVAQNRDRVFMVSILGDYSYKFPSKIKLDKRLKDYLEYEVDEKYYLNAKQLKKILLSNYEQMGFSRIKNSEDKHINCITTSQGGGREPKIAYALSSREFAARGWMDECPTLTARDYKDPKVVMEPTIIDLKSSKKFQRKPSVKISPYILTDSRFSVVETKCLNSKVNGKQPSLQDRIYDSEGLSTAITTSFMPSIAIPEATKQGYALAKDGDGVYINRPHQKRGVVQDGMIQTIKTSGDDLGVVIKGNYSPSGHNASRIVSEEGLAPTVKENHGTVTATINNLRIRKLTPRECWRLMGIPDQAFDKAQKVCSNSQLYKQAGNGIVVDVFAAILKQLFDLGDD